MIEKRQVLQLILNTTTATCSYTMLAKMYLWTERVSDQSGKIQDLCASNCQSTRDFRGYSLVYSYI